MLTFRWYNIKSTWAFADTVIPAKCLSMGLAEFFDNIPRFITCNEQAQNKYFSDNLRVGNRHKEIISLLCNILIAPFTL